MRGVRRGMGKGREEERGGDNPPNAD